MKHDLNKERVTCDICGSGEHAIKFEKNGFTIVNCKKCGLIYVNPRYKKDVLNTMYSNEVSPVRQYKETLSDDEKTFKKRIRLLEKFIRKDKPTVLDIGCSVGTFMKEMKKKGWEVSGIDVDVTAGEYWKRYGLDAKCIDFHDAALPQSHFDLIIMNDFIEHSHSPIQAFRKAESILKNNGLLFITTPNIESLIASVSGKRWLHLKPDEHLYYFSKNTMKKALEKSGFNVLWCSPLGRMRNLDTVCFKSQVYTKIIWKIVDNLRLHGFFKKIAFNINLGDEIGIIAAKKKTADNGL